MTDRTGIPLVFIRRPEKDPELFVQDADGNRIVVKLTEGQIWRLVENGLRALRSVQDTTPKDG